MEKPKSRVLMSDDDDYVQSPSSSDGGNNDVVSESDDEWLDSSTKRGKSTRSARADACASNKPSKSGTRVQSYEQGGEEMFDFRQLQLKPDHENRPLWVCPSGRILFQTWSPASRQAYDFLVTIAEPLSRPEHIHEYQMTPHSLYAAVSVGLTTTTILSVLEKLSKVHLTRKLRELVADSTVNYGKVKLVQLRNRYFVESPSKRVLGALFADHVVHKAALKPDAPFEVHSGLREVAAEKMGEAMEGIQLEEGGEGEEGGAGGGGGGGGV